MVVGWGYASLVQSAEVVRLDISVNTQNEVVDLLLYDAATPITVQNFLNYVDDGAGAFRYNGSFFHRSVSGFVLQGGGYTFDQSLGGFEYDAQTDAYPGGLQKILTDAPIVNEFQGSGLSNVRGTIAMAKLAGDPDSATSQWFVNLADNSANLDTQNGGFTVFGEVLDNGMDIIDAFMLTPTVDLSSVHPAMGEVPLDGYTDIASLADANFIRINSATRIQRPALKDSNVAIDFGLVVTGSIVTQDVLVENAGNADLVMDASSILPLSAPFSIISDTCGGATLAAGGGSTCTVTVQYAPQNTGSDAGRLQIAPSVNPANVMLSRRIIAEAVPTTPVLVEQNGVTSFTFSDTPVGSTSNTSFTLQNRGGGALVVQSIQLTGVNNDQFSTDGACVGVTLQLGETCSFVLSFNPQVEGALTAQVDVQSDAGSLAITVSGNGLGPELEVAPTSLDFGGVQLNDTAIEVIEVRNIGASDLRLYSISIDGANAADFVQQNTCPDVATLTPDTLAPNTKCLIIVSFTPSSDGAKSATLTFTSNDSDESTAVVPLSGFVADPDIDAPASVDMGLAQINQLPSYQSIVVTNRGLAPLEFSALSVTGAGATAFNTATDCPGIATYGSLQPLQNAETCTIFVQFLPDALGNYEAAVSLDSNDPDEGNFVIQLYGEGELDVDGISRQEEQAAPNGGDSNNDGLADAEQNNVASFLTLANEYATLVSAPGSVVFDVSAAATSSLASFQPDGLASRHGVIGFGSDIPSGLSVIQVFLLLPENDATSKIYRYGPTEDNPQPHWYDFSYDGRTGASFLGVATIPSPDGGESVTRQMVRIVFIDGERGDDDMQVNGEIKTTIAPMQASAQGGAVDFAWLLFIHALWLGRYRYAVRPNQRAA